MTGAILERHWLAVKMLAVELRTTGTVRRARAQELFDRWMADAGPGESLFQVLAGIPNARVEPALGSPLLPRGLKTCLSRPVRQPWPSLGAGGWRRSFDTVCL